MLRYPSYRAYIPTCPWHCIVFRCKLELPCHVAVAQADCKLTNWVHFANEPEGNTQYKHAQGCVLRSTCPPTALSIADDEGARLVHVHKTSCFEELAKCALPSSSLCFPSMHYIQGDSLYMEHMRAHIVTTDWCWKSAADCQRDML